MNNPEIIGIIAGIFTTSSSIPQIIKEIETKRTEDISLLMFLFIVIGVSLWLMYGLYINSVSLILWNGIGLILNLAIIFLKFKYRIKERKS